MTTENKHIALVKKWLADPESVSKYERRVNMKDAENAFLDDFNWNNYGCEDRTLLEVVSEAAEAAVHFSAAPIKASKLVEEYESMVKVEAENKVSVVSVEEDVTISVSECVGIDAPPNNLPDWNECSLRLENKEFLEENGFNKLISSDGPLLPNPIHEFIYEYDDKDPYKSAWFLHRLENLINFVRENKEAE